MAATALSSISTHNVPLPGPVEFGAYKPSPVLDPDVNTALGKTPLPIPANDTFRTFKGGNIAVHAPANENGGAPNPFGFSEKDNLWLKELGITSTNPKHVKEAWTAGESLYKTRAWSDSYGGRLAIRTFSRGILGAAFFAAGQRITATENWGLKNYSYRYGEAQAYKVKTPMDRAARFLDRTMGEGIRWSWGHITTPEKGINAVTFRNTRNYYGKDSSDKPIMTPTRFNEKGYGRSYGHEGLAITFDFGMASLGDHMGRDIANVIDPNIEKSWIKNGHIDLPKAALAVVKSLATGLTRAMGEDYFAMLVGYPYIVRMSRNTINHFSRGFKYDSDNALNGGSIKESSRLIDPQHPEKGIYPQIVGNYQMEGMLDLGFRFTIYNWFTKIFRDTYDWSLGKADRAIHHDKSMHFGHDLWDAIKHAPHNIIRNVIKTTIIMVPSMPFFFMFRSPQSKDVGLAINIDKMEDGNIKGPIGIREGDNFWPTLANGTSRTKRSELEKIAPSHRWSVYENIADQEKAKVFPYLVDAEDKVYDSLKFKGFTSDKFKGYEQRYNPYGTKVVWHDGITNFLGRTCYQGSQVLTEGLKKVIHEGLGYKGVSSGKIADFSRRMTYAAAAYTPYFAMKTDVLTAAYDTPRMNMAIDRAMSGASHLKLHELGAGLNEMGRAILGKPFREPARELQARRKQRDLEASLAPGEGEQNGAIRSRDTTPRLFVNEALKKKPLASITSKTSDPSWQSTIKQFKELQPDGYAIN